MIIDQQQPNTDGGVTVYPDWTFTGVPRQNPKEEVVIKGCGGNSAATASIGGTIDQSES